MTKTTNRTNGANVSRRAMLIKLGLAAGAVYASPTLLRLSEAKASPASRGTRASRGSRASYASAGRGRQRVEVEAQDHRGRGGDGRSGSR